MMNSNLQPSRASRATLLLTAALLLFAAVALAWRQNAANSAPQSSTGPLGARFSETASHSQADDAQRMLTEIDRRVTMLASEVSSLRGQTTAAPALSVAPAPRRTESTSGLTREEEMQRADEQIEEQTAAIERAVAGQALDPSWAPAAEASIRSVLQQSEFEGVKLLDARCRTSVCRIEIAGEPGMENGSFDERFRKLLIRTPWQGQGFGQVHDPFGASPTAVLFLAREGESLPLPH
jgi:hypothetical protein